MPFAILGSFAVTVSPDISNLLFWQFIQMYGCAGSFVIGAATIGDIYKVEEHGTAMSTFIAVSLPTIVVHR